MRRRGTAYAAPETSSKAVVALCLATASFVFCPLIPAVVALVLAHSAEREIAASGGRLGGAGLLTGARITAWINVGLSVAVLLLLVVLLAVGLSGSSSSGTATY